MMTVLEDLRLALRQICETIGLPAEAATAVSLIVLGVVLNIAAVRAVQYAGIGKHACHQRMPLQCAAQTELKVVRTVMVSTLKRIGNTGRRWCVTRQLRMGRRTEGMGYRVEVGFAWAALPESEGCDVVIASNATRKAAIALVQC